MSLDKTPVEKLIEQLEGAEKKRLAAGTFEPFKQEYFYASNIHSCQRHLYYLLSDGEKRPPVDEYLAALFAEGKIQELRLKSELAADGFEMIKAQERITLPYQGPVKELRGKPMMVGKIDGAFNFDGVEIPCEIKCMDPHIWQTINSVDDLLDRPYTEKYVKQLLMYQYVKSCENGIFILSDFKGHRKRIPVFLGNHMELAELALRTMEKAYEAYHSGQIPDRIAFHSKICGKCDFQAICLPEVTVGGDAQVIDDPELEASIEVHESLKDKKDAYEDLHDSILARLKAFSQSTVGKFIVKTKQRVRVSYDSKQLTDEQRAAIKKETTYTVMDIERIG